MSSTAPPWLVTALGEIGISEVPGIAASPRIVEYDAATTLKATSDEVPWCSAFVNWCVAQAGLRGTGSAAARSWLKWGVKTPPRLGAIAVFQRSASPTLGHVGFLLDNYGGLLQVLGGNQGNRVCIKTFGPAALLDLRWPAP